MEAIFKEIKEERARQDAEFGGPEADDKLDYPGWVRKIYKHTTLANKPLSEGYDRFRYQLVRISALAVAAIEFDDRKNSRPAANIFDEIAKERSWQDAEFGGPEEDDKKSISDWLRHIYQHTSMANPPVQPSEGNFRKQMVRVAALAVAAIQAIDRKIRAAKDSMSASNL
jgi:hypothetical protein